MAPKPSGGSQRTPASGNFQGVSPVLLSSAVAVLASNSAIPDSGQLTYPFRKAIWIEEIRWTLRMPWTQAALNMGALVHTKLSLGQKYLNRDAVPVWLFGTTMSLLDEEDTSEAGDTISAYSQYRWKLPEPLFVDAGQVLSSVFSRGADGFDAINARVTYVGKTVAPGAPRPSIISVPYVAPFITTLGNTYEQSNEKHLFNAFNRPLRVQRLTGRVLDLVPGETAAISKALTPVVAGSAVTIRMNDSWGGKMVNDYTGPSDVFDCLRSAWTVDTEMPAKGTYDVQVWNLNPAQQVHIALIGSRDEEI